MAPLFDPKKIVTRFPPSPTGYFHIGSARTALFNYLFAAHHGGVMYLRFEDTDRERSKKEFEEDIIAGLHWLGIEYPERSVLRQSERGDVYRPYIAKLLESGDAYEAEPAEGDRSKKVIRFRNPNARIVFQDLIRGEVSFDTTELGDFVIAKSVDEPLYHLAVVIDDAEMQVTHVIRGEDHISNTPRHILICEALRFPRPLYAHIPLILAKDRSKLSKRHGATSVTEYKRGGYLPEALANHLALLGWNPGGDREIFTRDELIRAFDLGKVQKSGAIFDGEKLTWFNREHLRKRPESILAAIGECGVGEEMAQKLFPLVVERVRVLPDVSLLLQSGGELDFVLQKPHLSAKLLPWKKSTPGAAKGHIEKTVTILCDIPDNEFHQESITAALMAYAESAGKGDVLWPVRVALSGKEKSLDPFSLIAILGKAESVERLQRAATLLS